jgi:hypothetical protein
VGHLCDLAVNSEPHKTLVESLDYPRSTPLVKYRPYANNPTISAGSPIVKIITRSSILEIKISASSGNTAFTLGRLSTRRRTVIVVPQKTGSMTDTSSSAWRTAYVAAIFETDCIRMALRIADARAAITERLNGPIEISKLEHESIEAARQGLATMKAKPVEVVKLAPTTGDSPTQGAG